VRFFFTLGNQENNLLGLVALRKRPLLRSPLVAQGFGAARLLRPRHCFLISCAMRQKYLANEICLEINKNLFFKKKS
jgi:hypothetical protein